MDMDEGVFQVGSKKRIDGSIVGSGVRNWNFHRIDEVIWLD